MEYSTGDCFGPSPAQVMAWWLLTGLFGGAVLLSRLRPAWLLRFWLAGWLMGAGAVLLRMEPVEFEGAPWLAVPGILLFTGVPTGLVTLWLARTRGHPVLSRASAQFAGALGVFAGSLAALLFVAGMIAKLIV